MMVIAEQVQRLESQTADGDDAVQLGDHDRALAILYRSCPPVGPSEARSAQSQP